LSFTNAYAREQGRMERERYTYMTKILISGDRNWTDKTLIFCTLLEYIDDVELVIEGSQYGADIIARDVAEELGINTLDMPADWDRYGISAGPRRNIQMLNEQPDLVLAFHDDIKNSKGTKHMIKIAKEAGVPVRLITHD